MKIRIDYKIECLAYLKLLETGNRITQKEFCRKRSQETKTTYSYQAFKQALSRLRSKGDPGDKGRVLSQSPRGGSTLPPRAVPDWAAIKDAYFEWKFKTLVEVASFVGQNPNSKSFSKRVAGWYKERSEIEIASNSKMLDILTQERATQRVRDIFAEALAMHYRLWDLLEQASRSWKNWKDPHKTPWHTQAVAKAVIDLVRAMEKVMPAILGLKNLQTIHRIFDGLQDGSMDLSHAAIEFARLGVVLPRPVEMLLTKHKPEEVPPENGEYLTDEMIMKRRAEILAQIDTERIEFVRARKQVVAQLRAETKDSFAVTDRANK